MNTNRNLWSREEEITFSDLVSKLGPAAGIRQASSTLGRSRTACRSKWYSDIVPKGIGPSERIGLHASFEELEKSDKGITVTTNANGGITIFIPLN